MSISEKELACWLVISHIPGFGAKRFESLLARQSSLSSYFNDRTPTKDFWEACHQLGVKQAFELDWKSVDEALSWQEGNYKHILTWECGAYPQRLKEIASKPPVLYVDGQLELLSSQQMGMVGSRRPSAEGRTNAFHFAYELAQRGFTITSGLAIGIDGASHEGALKAKGKTIAVLGQGLHHIYPAQHKPLAAAIRENGALVSEFSLSTLPFPQHFPRRNRIISGLSLGVLVVESSVKSGSLITAKYALEQNREIFALPGSIHNPVAKGCHQLIREGAKCVDDIQQILEEFPDEQRQIIRSTPLASFEEDPLLPFLHRKAESIDYLIQKSGLTAERVSSMLIELEIEGKVASVPGGYIRTVTGGTV